MDDEKRLGEQVLAFAERRLGQQVGDGECFALADQALQSAGALSAASFATISPDADYIWGRAVPLAHLRPGDILQFRDFQLQNRITRSLRLTEGGVDYGESLQVDERWHHTAIVEQVDTTTVTVLEQNVGPNGHIVQRNRLRIADGTETTETQDGVITVATTVEGELHAYRPVPAPEGQSAASPPS